ncbi:ATP-binding protein [Pseudomonas sp. RIT-PI-S]|uniref:ATP-binding protein n=1 Tax=Pseudomonas sp. RIT-PI-S TaxID=3035295 RepID=UPI0021DA9282|nr:ATP-binding protein [Pseudomonas sp. RIT-PI-S]
MTETDKMPSLGFLSGGGDMGARIRAFDWSSTPLGAPQGWPQSLQSALSICLNSSFPTAIYWAGDFRLLYNDAWAPVPGERHPAALGQPGEHVWQDIWHIVGPQLQRVWETGEGLTVFDQALPMVREGVVTETYWNYSLTPVRGEAGEVVGIFNQGNETTQRVLRERQRDADVARQRRMFEQAPGFMTILRGPEHIFDFVNSAYLRLFGNRDFLGRPIREVFPELAGQGFYEWLDQVYTTGERFVAKRTPIQLAFEGAPTEQRFLDFIYEPLTDETDRVIGIFCEGFDVTEAHLAQEALREQTRTLETLDRINKLLAADLDLERVVQTLTDAGVALTGAKFGAFFHNVLDESGERLALFTLSGADREQFNPLGRPRATPVFAPTFRNEGVVRSDDILADPRYGQRGPDHGMPRGHLPVRSYLAVSVVSRSGEVLGGLFFGHPEPGQFSERHERVMVALAAQAAIAIDNARLFQQVQTVNETLEQRVAQRTAELTQAHEALRQAQKMEAVGQLTGGIAHDFNNLLAGIIGSLEIVEQRLASGRTDGLERFFKGAQTSALRAAALTQRLLAFSRRQTLAPRPTDVNKLVIGMEELIRRTVGPAIEVEVAGADALWPACIDAAQLESALLNLAINARDAMPSGGRITLQTSNLWLDAASAPTYDLPPGQYLRIAVTDTGSGIAENIIERIFDPFFTTKPIGQGTGLGLSMVHGFVRQSGGQVRVHSQVGIGTTINLYLPRHTGVSAPEDEAVAEPTIEAGTGKTVLVIDDEATVRMLIVEVLVDAGYHTLEAENGPAGLKLLQANDRIDLLLTDVGLPGGMNGRQVADAARVARPDLKVLFVTGFAEHAILGDDDLETGMAVMSKPFAMAHLAAKVGEMLGEH